MNKLERMDDFFAARTDGYDEHMLTEVGGCANGYRLMAELVAELNPKKILDLGCGTGLELDEIFKLLPDVDVTGIDLTAQMLAKLLLKHPDKHITLKLADYFKADFGSGYDTAVSFQTMHHFTHEEKSRLYKKIFDSLTPFGAYIECDYMCETQEQEDGFFAELARLKKEQGLDGGFYHFDVPCTIENQIKLLQDAGFNHVNHVYKEENTVMLYARKKF